MSVDDAEPSNWLQRCWELFQANHCGMYSIERSMAFAEYCRSTSSWRVAFVCLMTPLPAVAIVTLLEIPPLRPPSDGCLANYVFWVRHCFAIAIILETSVLKAKEEIAELPLSHSRMIVVSLSCATVYVAFDMLIASYWVFPIPFLAVCGVIIVFPIWVTGILLAVGTNNLKRIPDVKRRLKCFLGLESTHAALMVMYPVYNAIFQSLPRLLRTPYLAGLPMLNLAMKNAVAAKGKHLEDRLPETVVLAVDAFSAIFSMFCMRSSNSFFSVAVIVVFDAVVVALSVYGMHTRTLFVREFINDSSPRVDLNARTRVVSMALDLLLHPEQLDTTKLHDIRLLSAIKHQLSSADTALLDAIKPSAIYDTARQSFRRLSLAQLKTHGTTNPFHTTDLSNEINGQSKQRVLHWNRVGSSSVNHAQAPVTRHSAISSPKLMARKKNTVAVKEVLRLLYASEYLCLIVYVQCVIPPAFILYMSALYNLPNAQYYPRAVELGDKEQMIARMNTITFYWGLELALLLVAHLVLARKFALPALYQIAFVLETHAVLVQCKLVFILIYSVQSAVEHYGADYSFQFVWMRSQSSSQTGTLSK